MSGSDDVLADIQAAYAEKRGEEHSAVAKSWPANPAEPYIVMFKGEEDERPHRFCPASAIAGADRPNCRKPLIRILSLKTERLPFVLGSDAPSLIPLLYCWTCDIPFEPFSYQVGRSGEVKLLRYSDFTGSLSPEGPYEGYTGVFPESRVGLRKLAATEVAEIRNSYITRTHSEPFHQIGGLSLINNPIEPMPCPICSDISPFFARICDSATSQGYNPVTNQTFTGNCGVEMVFHLCSRCWVITAYHSCD